MFAPINIMFLSRFLFSIPFLRFKQSSLILLPLLLATLLPLARADANPSNLLEHWGIADVTSPQDFEQFVQKRDDVWMVHFSNEKGIAANKSPAWLKKIANKLRNLVRVGRVDCARIVGKPNSGFAEAPCAKGLKPRGDAQKGKGKNSKKKGNKSQQAAGSSQSSLKALDTLLGYTFDVKGDVVIASASYKHPATGIGASSPDVGKVTKWAVQLAPKLAIQLTAESGINVLHKEELSKFLKVGRVAKAMFFTTSAKGETPG